MSALTINRKIAKGLAKVGKKLGDTFFLYRTDNFVNPLADRNLFVMLKLAWSKDEAFKQNPEPTLDYFTLYADHTVLQVGDILDSADSGRTFLVSDVNPIRGAVGVQCNRKMNVLRPVFTPTADKKTSFEEVVTQMPCVFSSASAASNDGALSPVTSSMTGGQSQVEVWTVLPSGTIGLNDVLEIDGLRFIITSLDAVSHGTKIKAKSTRAGK